MKKLALTLLLVTAAGQAYGIAGQLYKVESTPFATFIARHPGDILTVIVDEWSDTDDSGSRDSKRKTDAGLEITDLFLPPFNIQKGFTRSKGAGASPTVAWNSEMKTNNTAANKSSHKFETKLEVRLVEEIRPGQFIIRGHRLVNINGKKKSIFVSGVIRQRDITPFNTIRSHQIADGHVEIEGDVGGKDVADGLATKLYKLIF